MERERERERESKIIRPNGHKMEKGHFSDGAARSDTRFTKAVKAPNNFSSFSDFMGGRRRSGCDGYWPAGGQERWYLAARLLGPQFCPLKNDHISGLTI